MDNYPVRRRLIGLRFLFIIFYLVIISRLAYLQIMHHDFFAERAEGQRLRVITLTPDRGDIFDRNGNLLATSVDTYSLYLAPREIKNKAALARELSRILNYPYREVFSATRGDLSFVWLKRKLSDREAALVKTLTWEGWGLLREKKRVYPKGTLASQVIGFTGIDNQGLSGVELYFDESLRGRAGKLTTEYDPVGREILAGQPLELESPTDGMNLTLTIDETIQYSAERELKRAVRQYGGSSGSILVLDPKSGEILALASVPDFDPNRALDAPAAAWRPRPITDIYEPGSTFKIITAAAGLEEGAIDEHTTFYCPDSITLGGRVIKNSHPIFGASRNLGLPEILAQSLNTGAVQIGLRLGKERFARYIRTLGFGETTGIELPGEVAGIFKDSRDWDKPDIGMITFGQTIAVTPLQLIRAYASLVNGGVLIKPNLVRRLESVDGKVVKSFPARHLEKIASPQTVSVLKKWLEYVVQKGSGRRGKIAGYRVGGKTGTAQIANPYGGYFKGRYIASFVAAAPLTSPRLIVLVTVNDPQGVIWGETVAAPAVRRVLETSFRYFNIPPDSDIIKIDG